VLRGRPRDELRDTALELAGQIAAKSPTVIRAAKESERHRPWDVKRSYRFEQGFTFELNLSGRPTRRATRSSSTQQGGAEPPAGTEGGRLMMHGDKRLTEDEAVATLESGMTLGIGGWGSRRKPMSLVRALLRSPVTDLTVVSYGGPDVGLLCAAGKVRRLIYGFVSLDSIPLEPHFRAARQGGTIPEPVEYDEGMLQWALYAGSLRLPFLPTRAGLGTGVMDVNPTLRTVRSPYDDAEELLAVPAIRLDAAFVHLNRADARGNAQFLGPDLYFDDLFLGACEPGRRFLSCERVVPTEALLDEGTFHTLRINRSMVDGVIEAPNGAHFTTCEPDYGRDEAFQREYVTAAGDPETWTAFSERFLSGGERDYQEAVATWKAER
jgi:glutaconate CoA-transferase, subunit A